MIVVNCSRCGEELSKAGALCFSPPDFPFGMVDKFHLCEICWRTVREAVIGK